MQETMKWLETKIKPLIKENKLNEFNNILNEFLTSKTVLPGTSQNVSTLEIDDGMNDIDDEVRIARAPKKRDKNKKFSSDEIKEFLEKAELITKVDLKDLKMTDVLSIKYLAEEITNVYSTIERKFAAIKPEQYRLGQMLHYSKQYCRKNMKNFFDFIEKKTPIKSRTQINFYIKFYFFVKEFPFLINNDMSATLIMTYRKEIKEIQKAKVRFELIHKYFVL